MMPNLAVHFSLSNAPNCVASILLCFPLCPMVYTLVISRRTSTVAMLLLSTAKLVAGSTLASAGLPMNCLRSHHLEMLDALK